ncbi:glycoside hydrolase family 32 protein [Promicromonospora sp. NPDC059942]|uniref:glycoside hydrolase family 32 protein n=1 Tax=Promicromonospora sp. NPDC059942 TaxID=3347009 RepID=UPI003668E27A
MPTSEPVVTEPYRPRLHFSPARNWMNDPNGLLFHDGTYHLFFQHNPGGPEWGDIAWGHATSSDLLTWTEHSVAIPATEHEMIFSGSAVVDAANTSGLGAAGAGSAGTGVAGDGPLVAIYTSAYRDHPVHGDNQAQSVAFSVDGGQTWEKYAGNPVHDRDRTDYRDPKVFWFGPPEGGHWVMVAVDADASRLVVNVSDDLLRWRTTSTFESARLPEMWECPDLFPLVVEGAGVALAGGEGGVRWVLVLSTGGPGQHYVVGDFDGERFVEDAAVPTGRVDHGADFYAAASFNGLAGEPGGVGLTEEPAGRRVLIGWMGQAFRAPTSPWQGIMSAPRDLGLRAVGGVPRLVSRFSPEIGRAEREVAVADGVRVGAAAEVAAGEGAAGEGAAGEGAAEEGAAEEGAASDGTATVVVGRGGGLQQRVRARIVPGSASLAGIRVLVGDACGTRIGYDRTTGELVLDRSASGVVAHEGFATPRRVPVRLVDGALILDVLTDSMSVEVLANDGEVVVSELVFPGSDAVGVEVFAEGGGAVVDVRLADLVPQGLSD